MKLKISKKSLLILISLVFVNCFSFGMEKFTILKKPELQVAGAFICPGQTSLKNPSVSWSNVVSMDFSGIYFDTGYSFSQKSSNTVISAGARPFQFKNLELGFNSRYHLYDYYSVFYENDFLLGTYLKVLYKDSFRFEFGGGGMIKTTYFKSRLITNNLLKSSIYLYMKFLWNINDFIGVYFDFKSLDYYDYALFGTPFFKLGVNFNCSDKVTTGFDCTAKLTDMFAVSANISEVLVSMFLKVRI